ncbi:FUSC family protein [Streptomyces stelliscabiei]|nr:FUSC family protein [Streptomyces stelliscabiei]MDX2516081.1 FUSC family protein [Streptomyces stelliscabiei]MDX2553053.1 FUSC family protein [Streptomyces stelliscabiei]MDX2612041.1 FUSC family protein [Streptomyces stelliscabiei]MDX2636379.1 FUSC family protein [Streptomyces stelliscabiei]MDX2663130.1 FUSC family protein [Streptomyces stelliscabiei]
MFMAPDPGRLRLRVALRAVLGIGLAVTAAEAAGLSLTASIAAGLTALLALFTVADPTVRGQAVTTALLPAAGFPVLALATVLHDLPTLRDALWLVVIFCGVHARRWGPRGHALGIFAFMTFFVTQFLHAVPGQLPELYTAMTLALTASSAVRFGAWCIERRFPPPAAPAPGDGRGLARSTTRQAFQASAACAFAMAIGQVLSQERWYWAVGTAWWIFVNTTSRGETLVRGFRRLVGTVTGILVGLLVAVPLHGAPAPTAALVAVCVFGIFYTAAVSYSWMMLCVTVMAALLYGLLGVLDPALLGLRLAQTGVGALGAALAVALVLPVTTHAVTDRWVRRALHAVHACTATAARSLAGDPDADPAPHVAELEALLGRVRLSLAPLVHPLNPLRRRKERARRVLALLDDCAREARGLGEVVRAPHGTHGVPHASRAARADHGGPRTASGAHLLAVDADPGASSHGARLTAACLRVESAVETLVGALPERPAPAHAGARHPDRHPGAEQALAHLHGLERALADLAPPLRGSSLVQTLV